MSGLCVTGPFDAIVARGSGETDDPGPLFQPSAKQAVGAQMDADLKILTLLNQAGQLRLALNQQSVAFSTT